MRALASFASSDSGRHYAAVCERWGLDPGAPLMQVSDVLAFNLRAGLAHSLDRWRERNQAPATEADRHRDLIDKARAARDQVPR